MLIFADTEFTSLAEPYLILAGLVTESGREMYFELAGVSPAVCAPFVRETVLPLLDGPVLTPSQVAERVAAFLAPYGSQVTFFSDAPRYDIELLRPFLPGGLTWAVTVLSFETEADELAYEEAYAKAFVAGLRRHHALGDARAMRRALRS
jgi:hypothetical protein